MIDRSGAEALKRFDVSRETISRLEVHRQMLLKWRSIKNLIGPATVDEIWSRHFADSLQLRKIEPSAVTWIDIGTGAGFPGLVIAADLADIPTARVHLIEADHRRCAFLRETARAMGVNVIIHCGRAEDILKHLPLVNVITARAVAPLCKLVDLASPLLEQGAKCLFPRGRTYPSELTDLKVKSNFEISIIPSLTDPAAAVIKVTSTFDRSSAESIGV